VRERHPAEGARQHHRRDHQKPCGAARHHSPTSGNRSSSPGLDSAHTAPNNATHALAVNAGKSGAKNGTKRRDGRWPSRREDERFLNGVMPRRIQVKCELVVPQAEQVYLADERGRSGFRREDASWSALRSDRDKVSIGLYGVVGLILLLPSTTVYLTEPRSTIITSSISLTISASGPP